MISGIGTFQLASLGVLMQRKRQRSCLLKVSNCFLDCFEHFAAAFADI